MAGLETTAQNVLGTYDGARQFGTAESSVDLNVVPLPTSSCLPVQHWLHHAHNQEAESGDSRLLLSSLSPPAQFRMPAKGMRPPTGGGSSHLHLYNHINPLETRSEALVVLDSFKLPVSTTQC